MKHGKRMLSLLLALALVLGMGPLPALAEEVEGAKCDCVDAVCTSEQFKKDCPVCGVADADLTKCDKYVAPEAPQDEGTKTLLCACETVCTPEALNKDCPVCGVADADLTKCVKYVVPESQEGTTPGEETKTPACNCEGPCAEGAMKGDCPRCGQDGASVEGCGKYEEPSAPSDQPEAPVCLCGGLPKCAEGAMNPCALCVADLTQCLGTPAEEAPQVKTITAWVWEDENELLVDGGVGLIWDTVAWAQLAAMLPSLRATVGEGEETIALTWSCADVAEGVLTAGTHTLVATLPEGYALAEGLAPLTLTLDLGGGDTYEGTGAFIVEGEPGSYTYGPDPTSSTKGILTITGGTVTVSMANGRTTTDRIVVQNTANVTLNGVNIQFNDGKDTVGGTCAFEVQGTCSLTLVGENRLVSGNHRAGLKVAEGHTLTIIGEGSLFAQGGNNGAGIGGGELENGGNITISGGSVTAQGGEYGTGIGGGRYRDGGNITIIDGTVNALGGRGGAGIGGGSEGDGGNITISGGTVAAQGGIGGADIGGGGRDGIGGIIRVKTDCLVGSPTIGSSFIGACIVFKDGVGVIQDGDNMTLPSDLTVGENETLTIPANTTLDLGNHTLTNNGKIICLGTINGPVTGNQPFYPAGDFLVDGDPSSYSYDSNSGILTITGNVTVTMAPGAHSPTSSRIVAQGTTNITLNNVEINVCNDGVNAFIVDGTCVLTLEGSNVLQSDNYLAGLLVESGDTLTITEKSTGSLKAFAGAGGAGIGGNYDGDVGTIAINGGKFEAYGGTPGGAGIGGGGNSSNDGTLLSGTNGKAWIEATSIGADMTNFQSGTVFNGNDGTVYGKQTLNWNYVMENTLTIPQGSTLTIPADKTLTVNGELTNNGTLMIDSVNCLSGPGTLAGSGDFYIEELTESMIEVPQNLVYTGAVLTPTFTLFGPTILGRQFTITSGWDLQGISPTEVKNAGNYTVTYQKGNKKVEKTFTVAKSGSEIPTDDITLDKADGVYTYGDTITVTAKPKATGVAARTFAAPTANQMAIFRGDIQLSAPADPNQDGSYTMAVNTTALGAGEHELTAQYVGNDNMARTEKRFTVQVAPAALASGSFTVDTGARTYTGTAIQPQVTCADPAVTFDVAYANNVNAGTAKITVNGKGNYGGTLTYTFQITKANPAVTWPRDLSGDAGKALSTVSLPAGFAWADGTTEIAQGEKTYPMTFTPADPANYNTLRAEIPVMGRYVLPPEETDPDETEPDETVPEETAPTVPEETVPDVTPPTITGIQDNTAYLESVTFTVTDENLATVTVDGETVTLTGGQYTIQADNKAHTVIATDQAGNKTTVNIRVLKLYVVTYKASGKVVNTQRVPHGYDAVAPEVPAKSGYYGRWDHNGKNITEDTVITAKYSRTWWDNPKTGDAIGTAMFLLIMSATALTAIGGYALKKRRRM